jgi:hypothetical protein
MLQRQRVAHPGLTPAERQAALKALAAQVEGLSAQEPAARAERAAGLLDLPPVLADAALKGKALAAWRSGALAQATAIAEAPPRCAALLRLSTDPRLAGGAEASAVTKALAELRKDATTKPEFEAWAAWQQYAPQVAQARSDGAKKKLREVLAALAVKWPGSAGAAAAQEALGQLGR